MDFSSSPPRDAAAKQVWDTAAHGAGIRFADPETKEKAKLPTSSDDSFERAQDPMTALQDVISATACELIKRRNAADDLLSGRYDIAVHEDKIEKIRQAEEEAAMWHPSDDEDEDEDSEE